MKRFKMALSLVVASSLFLATPATFATTKTLSLDDAITLSKENSADIRNVLNKEFSTQDTIRKNIQNSYQLERALDTYYDYISIYNTVVDADNEYPGVHPFYKYIGQSREALTKDLTILSKKYMTALMTGQSNQASAYEKEMGFIQLYMYFGDNPGLTKESKYENFKKNEAMLQNSVELIQTQYDQGLIAATKMTESGVIKLYVGLKDLEQGLEVQNDLLQVYVDGLEDMKASYEQGLVSKIQYENQINTVEIERLKTENLQFRFDNLSYQMKKLCAIPMASTLNLSTNFDNTDYHLDMPSEYYERAYNSNMDYVNLQAKLTYNEKNFEVMNKYLDDYDKDKDFTKQIYYQEKVDQQETIDDLNAKIAHKKQVINSNVTLACNDLIYKAKLVDHNKALLALASANLNSGIQSYKLGQITELELDQLRIQYESAVMTASQNKRSYDKSVENFKLLLDYGVTYSAE